MTSSFLMNVFWGIRIQYFVGFVLQFLLDVSPVFGVLCSVYCMAMFLSILLEQVTHFENRQSILCGHLLGIVVGFGLHVLK